MSKVKKKFFVFLYIHFVFNAVNAQVKHDINIIGSTPQASNLGIYADIPIGYDTGTPTIEIPIWTIKSGSDFSLPIKLSYHASGIKVSQESSWVGLGWVLNAGGVITTTIVGENDSFRINNKNSTFPDYPQFPTLHLIDELLGLEDQYILRDLQPDIHHFNFCGYTGKFLYQDDGTPVFFPHKEMKIEKNVIIDDKGVRYSFEAPEIVKTVSKTSHYRGDVTYHSSSSNNIVSRYLTEINLPLGQKIVFNYLLQKYKQKYAPRKQNEYILATKKIEDQYVTTTNREISGKYLSSIVWDGGRIEFETKDRVDLEALETNNLVPQLLHKIKIYNLVDVNPIKVFEFQQEYFNHCYANCTPEEKASLLRLKLKSVKEYNGQGDCKTPYSFSYDESRPLEKKQSNQIDHWGYFSRKGGDLPTILSSPPNGKISYFKNNFNFHAEDGKLVPYFIDYSFRDSSFPEMQVGTMTQIKYPTGGYTKFEYEPNTYNTSSLENGNYNSYKGFFERIEISRNTTNNHQSKKIVSDNPIEFKFYMSASIGDCSGSEYDCYDRFGDNRISVVNNKTGDIVMDVNFGYYNDPPFYFNQHFLGFNVSSSNQDIPRKDLILPAGSYTLSVRRDEDNPSYIMGSLHSYNTVSIKTHDFPTTIVGGGLRIKTKSDYDSNDILIKQSKYQYENGVLYDMPNYHDYKNIYCPFYDHEGYFYPSPSIIKNSIKIERVKGQRLILNSGVSKTIISSQISYGKVTVHEQNNYMSSDNNGYTVYEFLPKKEFSKKELKRSYFFSDCSSLCSNQSPKTCGPSGFILKDSYNYNYSINKNYFRIFDSSPYLKSKKVFFEGSTLPLYTETNEYEHIELNPANMLHANLQGNDYGLVKGLYVSPINVSAKNCYGPSCFGGCCSANFDDIAADVTLYRISSGYTQLVSKKTTSNLQNNKSIQVTRNYSYDSKQHTYLTKETTLLNNSHAVEATYIYPPDFQSDPILNVLTQTNQISTPVTHKTFKTNAGNTTKLSETLTEYSTFPIMDNHLSTKMMPLAKNTYQKKGEGAIDFLTDRTLIYHTYDSRGNPLEISKKDGTHTVYLYGYSKQHLIAQIQNATFGEVATALGVSESALEGFNETHIGQINGLRAQKPEWMITTYTYIPLVGMKTQTDPKGHTTTYEYDAFNRLKHIKDHDGNILESYDYNYKTD